MNVPVIRCMTVKPEFKQSGCRTATELNKQSPGTETPPSDVPLYHTDTHSINL